MSILNLVKEKKPFTCLIDCSSKELAIFGIWKNLILFTHFNNLADVLKQLSYWESYTIGFFHHRDETKVNWLSSLRITIDSGAKVDWFSLWQTMETRMIILHDIHWLHFKTNFSHDNDTKRIFATKQFFVQVI